MCAHPLGNTVTVLNGPVLAEDKDIGPNAVVKYRLLGARVDLFTVDADTGNIMTCQQVHTERDFIFQVISARTTCMLRTAQKAPR